MADVIALYVKQVADFIATDGRWKSNVWVDFILGSEV